MNQTELAPKAELDPHEVVGEVPVLEPKFFARAVRQHFESATGQDSLAVPDNHELVTKIEDQTVPVVGLKFKLKKAGNFAVEHKTEIIAASAAVITVAGLLKARHHLRIRKK